jgi:electron transport complex protein RnfG
MSVGRSVLRNGLILGLFAVVGTALVALTYEETRERIAANEQAAFLRTLHEVLPPADYDNDILGDTIQVVAPDLLGTKAPVTVYRARKAGRPVAVILSIVAPDGYSGAIRLLLSVREHGAVSGARVLAHRETPGLGDIIEIAKSPWMLGFDGKSLRDPEPNGWRVRKDGGVFDHVTGATVTPRAVVRAIYQALRYFDAHSEELVREPHSKESGHG